MVFAELLGGMINRGGERFRESEARRLQTEDWQRQNDLALRTNFLRENWANMTPEQQQSQLSGIEPLIGLKKGALGAMVTPAQAIHQAIPPQYAPPALGEPRTGAVTATPSTEAPTTIAQSNFQTPIQTKYGAVAPSKFAGQSIEAPANIQIGQIPTPAETATPSIFARQPGYKIQSEPGRLQMTPNQIAARQKLEQEDAETQRKVNAIMNNEYLSDADKSESIRALFVPPAVLAAQARTTAGPPQVGLTPIQMIDPKNPRQVISIQTTRTGQWVYSGTNTLVPPEVAKTLEPRFKNQPHWVMGQDGHPVLIDTETFLNQMKYGQTPGLVGSVDTITAAETKTPLVDVNTNQVAGEWGSRSGLGGMRGTGAPVAPSTPGAETPTAPPELGKSARPKAEMDTRTYYKNAQSQLDTILEIANRRPDLLGLLNYGWEGFIKRGVGLQKDEDANILYGSLDSFAEDLIRAKEGAVIPNAMYQRLRAIVAGRAWTNPQQFADDMARAKAILTNAQSQRGINPEAPAAKPERRTKGGGGGAGAGNTITIRRKSDGAKVTIPRREWDQGPAQFKALYDEVK